MSRNRTEFIGAKLHYEDKNRKWKRKIDYIDLWDMRYLENNITEFNQYSYKIRYKETNLSIFYGKLPYQINSIISEKYFTLLEKAMFSNRISYLRKWVNDQWGNQVEKKRKRQFFKNKSFNKQV